MKRSFARDSFARHGYKRAQRGVQHDAVDGFLFGRNFQSQSTPRKFVEFKWIDTAAATTVRVQHAGTTVAVIKLRVGVQNTALFHQGRGQRSVLFRHRC